MQDLKNPWLMLILWIIGGIIALCGAFAYSELGAAIPRAGGEYAILSHLYHPSLGFLSGWVSFIVGFSAPIAASAIGFSEYLFRAFPEIATTLPIFGFIQPIIAKKIVAMLIIAGFTFIHMRGIEFGTLIQNYLTLLKVGLIVVLIGLAFVFGNGNWAHLSQGEMIDFSFGNWKTMGLSLMWIMFAYSGWNAATYIGSEIKTPQKTLPRSLIAGTAIVMLLYFLLNLFYVYAIPPSEMKGVISIGGLAVGRLFGPTLETLFSILIAFALFSSLSAFIILGPRVYYAMARDGYFFKSIAQIHPRFKVPVRAIILQGSIALIMVISGTFDQILTYMGFSLGVFPILAVFGVFLLRKKKQSPVRMPGFPIIPFIYIISGISMLLLSYFERPLESSIAILTVVAGIPFYLWFKHFYSAQSSEC